MHSEYKRIVPSAENAVLFVHGIVSTPRYFDDFAAMMSTTPSVSAQAQSQLPQEGALWSVHNLLLPGHGGSVKDFGAHTAKEWATHVHAALEELRQTHERIYIVAHSLGTLLAIREAVRDSRKIAGMLLLCVPLRICPKPSALLHNALKGVGLAENNAALHTYYGIEQDWRVWRYIGWIPRYLELFRLSRAARQEIHQLTVPAAVYMAAKDELVSLRSERDMKGNPAITLHRLPESMHHDFSASDKAALLNALKTLCGT